MTQNNKRCAFGCGRAVHKGKRLCKRHLEHQRLKMAEYRAERKEKGLCSRCGNEARTMPDGNASTLCEDCRTFVRELETGVRDPFSRGKGKALKKKAKAKRRTRTISV